MDPLAAAADDAPDGDATVHPPLGGWFFRNRSWLPVPWAILLVVLRFGEVQRFLLLPVGAALTGVGLCLRAWSVWHIGGISRTRAGRLGPLVTSGPYGLIRNPLYVANFLLWTGVVVMSELLWMLPVAWLVFAVQYSAIVKWEEAALRRTHGPAYDEYSRHVSRWLPLGRLGARSHEVPGAGARNWRAVLFSERGTLAAVALMTLLLVAKEWLAG